jgi:phage repressor protein C with HTH and peptisase S24 domain
MDMPAAVILIGPATRWRTAHATWSLLELARPGAKPVPLGILLVVDDTSGKLTLRLRGSAGFDDLEEEDLDILDFLESDLRAKALDRGGQALIDSLEDTLSNFLRIGDRTAVACTGDPQKLADRLFDEHVDATVQPFVTHLPVYSLRAAATRFGEGMQSEQEGWVRAPGHLTLHENMFVARVVGRSREPLIPDGSLCIFRAGVTGTRQGKRLLIEQFGETDFAARYTVKRYTSKKRAVQEDDAWEHERIRLEPLNREFAAFDLGPDEFRAIAEFVAVIEV